MRSLCAATAGVKSVGHELSIEFTCHRILSLLTGLPRLSWQCEACHGKAIYATSRRTAEGLAQSVDNGKMRLTMTFTAIVNNAEKGWQRFCCRIW